MTTFVHTAIIDSGDSDGPNIILATTYDVLIRCIAENYADRRAGRRRDRRGSLR